MTFLQPYLLWALPLALLPLLVHLLNRMRFRTVRWAAIEFLLRANRASTRHAKLRQFLILACRVLALAALGLMLARPLAGGWMGFAFSGAPDTVLLLVDRSASMETLDPGTQQTRRERALELLAKAGAAYGGRSRFVLVDSALLTANELATVSLLPRMSIASPTDTAADLPAMMDAAGNWLRANSAGRSEIWIASDLQSSNWHAEDDRWKAAVARLQSHPAGVRVRLLAFTSPPGDNRSIEVRDVQAKTASGEAMVTLGLHRTDPTPATLPIAVEFSDARSEFETEIQGQSLVFRHTVPLNASTTEPWGRFDLPADANLRDNTAYFLAPGSAKRKVAVIASQDAPARRILSIAAAPAPEQLGQSAELIPSLDIARTNWSDYVMVLWQDAIPEGAVGDSLLDYIRSGGIVVFFPPGKEGGPTFQGISWGSIDNGSFPVAHWDQRDGPLADSQDGMALPVPDLNVSRRQKILGDRAALATFADSEAFLARKSIGKGSIWFASTLPEAEWSNLASGPVLVPMLLRLSEAGAARLFQLNSLSPGAGMLAADPSRWTRVEPATPADVRVESGVYRNGELLVAVNRPAAEDDPDTLAPETVKTLFGSLPSQWFEEKSSGATDLQTEIWRALLIAMVLFLLSEAALILPPRNPAAEMPAKPKRREPEMAKAA